MSCLTGPRELRSSNHANSEDTHMRRQCALQFSLCTAVSLLAHSSRPAVGHHSKIYISVADYALNQETQAKILASNRKDQQL